MAKLRLKKVRSTINRPARQKATMEALGLRKMNSVVEVEVNPQIMGMVNKVKHLVEVTEL
jgi:large subunit ribosomal protein L30